jgi:hypothetical protein
VTSLRDRIAAKARRTATLPLQVGDTAAAAQEVAVRRAQLDLFQQAVKARVDEQDGERTEEELERIAELQGELRDAKARQEDTVALIELVSLPDDEFDAILGAAPVDDGGDIDLEDVRAALLAASCTDESLRDEAWWEEQLADPKYSKGDKLAINNVLLGLNMNTPDGRQGNG